MCKSYALSGVKAKLKVVASGVRPVRVIAFLGLLVVMGWLLWVEKLVENVLLLKGLLLCNLLGSM